VAIVLSSPLVRCRETAQAIAEAVGARVAVRRDLVECDFGEWEGRPFAEVSERYPEELAAWLASAAVAPPGGESFHEVGARTSGFVEWLRAAYPGQLVVAVTHVSPIKLILREALAATDDFLYRCFLSPAGLSTVDWYADGGVAVRSINDLAHLE
jgi:probable phosphoglycerate mutase